MAKFITKENARKIGILGGRPQGVLNKSTMERIKTKEAFAEIVKEHAGFIANNLLIGSKMQDTAASKELLERAFGKVPQGVQMQVATFSLKELAEYRKGFLNPPEIVPALPLQEPKENEKNDVEKKTT